MPYRLAAGRERKPYKSTIAPRDLLRRHLRTRDLKIKDLATCWDVADSTVYRLMNDRKVPLHPQHYELAAKHLDLTIAETQELLRAAAREAGWNIHD